MTKKSTATKSAATKSAATKSTRKSSASRTKLPETTPVIIEAVAPPAEVVKTVVSEATETDAVAETVVAVEPEATVETPVIVEAMAPPTRNVTREEFTAMVRREAYARASARGFRNGNPFEDWVRAEADVRAKLSAEGATFPAD